MTHTLRLLSCLAIVCTGGCGVLLGLDDFEDAPDDGAGASTSSQGGAGPGQGGGGSGTGGSGNTGGTFCEAGTEEPCYTGPAGTVGEGVCIEGTKTCAADGSEFGACQGEVVPAAKDDCRTLEDENCDGQPNDACPCMPNQVQNCYTGPAGTAGTGICVVGTQQCDAQGMMFGPCTGDVTPQPETCNTLDDDDCDGQTNEEGAGCVCVPGSSEACYTGPNGTSGVGVCKAGMHQCNAQGTEYGPCNGETLPDNESCQGPDDEDCDGFACSEPVWAKGFGSAVAESAAGIGADSAGNIYLTGNFGGTVDFGNGQVLNPQGASNVFLAKLSPAGVCQWAKGFSSASTLTAVSLAVSPAGLVVITGQMSGAVNFGGNNLNPLGSSDIFLARFGTDGAHAWSKRLGDDDTQSARDVVFTSGGDVALLGNYLGQFAVGGVSLPAAATQSILLAQFTGNNGTHVWSRGIVPTTTSSGSSIAADDTGNIYVGGSYNGTWNPGCGSQSSSNAGTDGWFARFDGTGNCAWSKLITGADVFTLAQSLDVDGTTLWIHGRFNGAIDIGGEPLTPNGAGLASFLARISTANGTPVFVKALDGVDGTSAGGVAAAPGGGVYVGGIFQTSLDAGGGALISAGGFDIYLARYEANGNHTWSKAYGDATDQVFPLLGRNGAYDLLFAGTNGGNLSIGSFALASQGGNDAFVSVIGH